MNRFRCFVVFAAIFLDRFSFAAESTAQAYLLVAVAMVQAADENPDLEQSTPKYRSAVQARELKSNFDSLQTDHGALKAEYDLLNETNSKTSEALNQLIEEKSKLERAIEELRKLHPSHEALPPKPPTPAEEGGINPMKLEPKPDGRYSVDYGQKIWANFRPVGDACCGPTESAIVLDAPLFSKASAPTQNECWLFTGRKQYGPNWCPNCPYYERLYGDGNESLKIIKSDDLAPGDQTYPALRFKGADGQWSYPAVALPSGHMAYHLPKSLEELADIVSRNSSNVAQSSYGASGKAGKMRIRAPIRAAKQNMRDYLGVGNTFAFEWERNGAAKLPLLNRQNWDAQAICGTSGRFKIIAPKSNLPVTEAAIAYRIVGSDIIIDGDPIRLAGLADLLNPNSKTANASPVGVIGIDDMLLGYQIFSILRDIASILWPSVDLVLPNNIAFTAKLDGDSIIVDFQRAPSVKIVALFTFNLALKQLVFSDENAHVEFSGSAWIKSRDFDIVD